MKKSFAFVFILLISVLAVTLFVNVSLANPYVPAPNREKTRLFLPESKVYSSSVHVSFAPENPYSSVYAITSVYGVKFYLDGDLCENVRWPATLEEGDNYVFNATLDGVREGEHRLYVVAYFTYVTLEPYSLWIPTSADGSGASNAVYFTVENPFPPVITLFSPRLQQIYNTSSVQLDFAVSKPIAWMGYSLDRQDNVTVTSNSTLTDLTEGTHEIVVYATDNAGQTGRSHIRYFNIETSLPSAPPAPDAPTTFSTSLVIAIVVLASVVAVSFGLVAYFVRRNRKTSK